MSVSEENNFDTAKFGKVLERGDCCNTAEPIPQIREIFVELGLLRQGLLIYSYR